MRYQRIFVLAISIIALWTGARATGDEFISKDSLSNEPFGDVKPFDLSKPKTTEEKPSTKETSPAEAEEIRKRTQRLNKEIFNVNDLGDPERIVFDGVTLFSEKQLRLALACDLKYQAAARPSNSTSDYLRALEKRLLEGYLNSGCPDAKVQATRDSKRQTVIVHVDEGRRFLKGQVIISGARAVNEPAIREFLTKSQRARAWAYVLQGKRLDIVTKENKDDDEKPAADKTADSDSESDPVTIWESGEPIDFRRIDNSQLERGVRFALAESGHPAADFHLDLERDEKQGVANLHISIPQEMAPAVAADIEVTGLKRDSRDVLLNYLKLKPGDAITAQTLRQLDERLTNSCRYWTHRIEVSISSAPGHDSQQPQTTNCKLLLKLEEFTPTPPLDKPLSALDETMRKCADWLNSLTKDFGPRDLVITTAAADLGGLLQHAQMVLTAEGTTALDLQLATGDWRIDHSAIIGPNGVELYDWKHNDKYRAPSQISPTAQLVVSAKHEENGEQRLSIHFGYAIRHHEKESSPTRFPIEVRAEPVAMLRFIHEAEIKTESRNGTLTLKVNEVELQADESTGAIQSLKCASFLNAGISAVDFSSKQGLAAAAIEKMHRRGKDCENQFDDKNPLSSAATYAIQQIERQPSIRNDPKSQAFWRLMGKISTTEAFQRLTNPETYATLDVGATTNKFEIPGHPEFTGNNWEEFACYYIPIFADKAFPRGSWPWTVLREIQFTVSEDVGLDSQTNHAGRRREYARINAAREFGPLCGLVTAELCRTMYPSNTKDIVENANDGLRDMSDEAFLRDARLLTDDNHGLAVLCRAIVEACGKMSSDDEEDLLKVLPPEYHGTVKALLARRKARPDEPAGDALRSLMLDEWHKSWKGAVETKLNAIVDASKRSQTGVPATK